MINNQRLSLVPNTLDANVNNAHRVVGDDELSWCDRSGRGDGGRGRLLTAALPSPSSAAGDSPSIQRRNSG